MTSKIAIAIAGIGLLLGLVAVALILQLRSAENAATATEARQARQIAALRAQLAAVSVKAGGAHRDLITCGDLNTLINQMPQTDSNGDTVLYAGPAGTLPLPAHCLNL